MALLKEHDVSIIADEVQTFARTPSLFAYQYFGLEHFVDIVTIGKVAYTCATLFKESHNPRPNLLSQTFTSSTSAIRATLAALEHIIHGDYFGPTGKIVKMHQIFLERLSKLAQEYPQYIHGPFGIGAMVAFTPFNGEEKQVKHFIQTLFNAGVIAFIAGSNPSRIRFLIPVGVLTLQNIDEILHIVKSTLLHVGQELCL
jgi:4-aminobutyrate aminotransferase-like enzyme